MLLGLYGAGATGKMLYDQLEVDPNIAEEFEKVVFIDDTPGLTKSYGLEVYSFEDTLKLYSPDDLKFLVTLGNPKARETVWKKMKSSGYRGTTWVHPEAFVSPSAEIEEGVIIDNCVIDSNVVVKSNVYVYRNALVGHDSIIGEHSIICAASFIGGHTTLEKNIFFGGCAACRDGITIGHDSVIGINSAVYKDVPECSSVIGNPARNMKRSEKEIFN